MRPDDTPRKRCTKCGEMLPATAEFFYPRSDRKTALKSECKKCSCARSREWGEINREQRRASSREYRSTHREQKAAYRESHREHERAVRQAYHAKNREKRNAYCVEYHAAHRVERAAYAAAYNAEHRDMGAARSRNRRARERSVEGTHTVDDVLAQYRRQRGRCYWCGEPVGGTYDVDHVVPISRGGSNGPENLVVACPTCNRSKHDKMPHEFSDRLC